ncbi:uncharacterized protein C8orf48 homolog isoform X2 [Carettochelys insculpta]|uniref:uncharacterized protein C8orf48 homolog isoform X2 n=1 Tax=Carettochelys insculpta TaxID=44489 RepID=UPI003EB74C60
MDSGQSCSTTASGYSEDTFESFSEEEEEEACRQYESEPFESYCSTEDSEWPAVSDISESVWQSASQDDEEITDVSDEELDALQSFCTIKISHIHHRLNSKQSNSNRHKDLQNRFTSEKPVTGVLNCTIPDRLVNRIHLKNISETMKQVTGTKVHQLSQCHDCKKKREELAKVTFLRQKKTLVEKALLQVKLEEQIYAKDSLTLIGEIHQNLPKLSEDPKSIWQSLNEKGQKV